ncbi:hypothetical protein BS17DRAFT_216485 [Gyrodon lividus]|nr:hypothetical protein BS17DRAFT_216485 [Gyrodon lividus]
MRHIFTDPSTSLGGGARSTRPCNAELQVMDKVEAAHIAYACVQAHFGISSENKWVEKDGSFSYRLFYYTIVEDIEDCEDLVWKDDILKYYNKLLFQHENGRDAGSKNKLASSVGGAPESFLMKMRAQAAARASERSKIPERREPPPGPSASGAVPRKEGAPDYSNSSGVDEALEIVSDSRSKTKAKKKWKQKVVLSEDNEDVTESRKRYKSRRKGRK